MTGFSTWCWLLVSASRYAAVYHPLWHLSHKKVGLSVLLSIMLFSFTINGWLLWTVVSYSQVNARTFLLKYKFIDLCRTSTIQQYQFQSTITCRRHWLELYYSGMHYIIARHSCYAKTAKKISQGST